MTVPVPKHDSAPINQHGRFAPEWYLYLKTRGEAQAATEAAEQPEYKLVGPLSIVVSGLLQNGLASLALKNDQLAPAATSYYGADEDGAKGWHLIGDALDVTADLTKAVDGTTNVTTFGLADLADTGGGTFKLIDRDAKGRAVGTSDGSAADVPYDNTTSGLTADDVQAAIDELASGGGVTGAMTFVGTATVAGAAATSLTLSSLDLATDGRYIIYGKFANATASVATISLYYNGDATATNYYVQFLQADGATVTATRPNSAGMFSINASNYAVFSMWLARDGAGYPRGLAQINRHAPASMQFVLESHVRNNTANVTSITFTSSVASALAIGSTFSVYKVS